MLKRARVLALRALRGRFHIWASEFTIYYTVSFVCSALLKLYKLANKLRVALRVRLSSIPYETQVKRDPESIMRSLDYWVFAHSPDGYLDEHFLPRRDSPDPSIQQVRKEILEFVRILLLKGLDNSILEIGLGNYGGTHILWRHIFNRVITVEPKRSLVKNFKLNERLDYRSIIIVGKSEDPITLKRVRYYVDRVDVLFIDGHHAYERVASDWSMYHNFVRPGGIIAFHDSVCRVGRFGVARFLEDLSKGIIDGKCHTLHNIVYSDHVGISYEEC